MSFHRLNTLTKIYRELRIQRETLWARTLRPSQKAPEGSWRTWLIVAGRGFGKTRTGSETLRQWVLHQGYRRLALIGRSIDEAKNIMVEGESGLLSVHPSWENLVFHKSERRLSWPNGAQAWIFGGDAYERLRGPQFDAVWIDEWAKFRHPEALLTQVNLALRINTHPRCIITTTPRPLPILEQLMTLPSTVVTRGTTFDNASHLSPSFLRHVTQQWGETQLGAQELYGEILTERQGALWSRSVIRYDDPDLEHFSRIVIAIDPATTHHAQSDETGIVIVGQLKADHFVVLDDLSGRHSPGEWGQKVVEAYHRYRADRVVAEVNKGGDLVERILTSIDSHIAYRAVRATRGKVTRAEPIAALYEQGKVSHRRPFRDLEHQLCTYVPGESSKSPDRLDALVWALTDLMTQDMGWKIWGASL